MGRPVDQDIAKLPKWAQKQFSWLKAELRNIQAELRQFEGKEATNVYMGIGLDRRPLRRDATICFTTKDGETLFSCRLVETPSYKCPPSVTTRLYVNGAHRVLITPETTNAFYVSIEED